MATIDASIYGNIKPLQVESPINALAQVTQLKNAQNQNRLFDMQVADSERARADDDAVRAAYQLADPAARSEALRSASPKAYREEQKFQLDTQKSQREAEKQRLEAGKIQMDLIGRLANSVKDQPSYEAGLQQLSAAGVDISKIPQQYDPVYVSQAAQQAMSVKDQIDQVWKQKGYDLDVAKYGYQKTNDAANRGVTLRGQNMTDSRARDLAAATREAAANGRIPSGYRAKGDGTLEPIPGGPADPQNKSAKATTEGEKAAAGYGLRMVESEKIIDQVSAKDPKSQKPGILERVAGDSGFANLTRDSARQQYRQAQEDWVRAKLRKESGAAIPTEEMDREIQAYFPQIGEKPDVIEQKRKARATATKAMGIAAGSAEPQMHSGGASQDIFSQADAILKGK